jgi:hypothetical protein
VSRKFGCKSAGDNWDKLNEDFYPRRIIEPDFTADTFWGYSP